MPTLLRAPGPTTEPNQRRAFLAWAGAGVLLAACRRTPSTTTETTSAEAKTGSTATADKKRDENEKEEDVGAIEDLMREHGVIRRVLVVYRDAAARLRTAPASVPPDVLPKSAKLIRSFAEDYHEKQLEEAHIFPALRAHPGAGAAGSAIDVLTAQHQRGREITDYLLAMTGRPITAPNAATVAKVLEGFARMYEEHAAIEDTVLFPAWKKTMTRKQLVEMGERFEEIEHRTFGKDGFDDAVDQITGIEKALGIELGAVTAPPPPKP